MVLKMPISWPKFTFPPINLWNVWKMAEPKNTVDTDEFKGFTNHKCEFFPCHDIEDAVYVHNPRTDFNCLFCYCPLQFLECPGPYNVFTDSNGITRKDCTHCTIPHDGISQSWEFIQDWLVKPVPWDGT